MAEADVSFDTGPAYVYVYWYRNGGSSYLYQGVRIFYIDT
jgi:hypothetical protein